MLTTFFKSLGDDKSGATAVEYGLIVSLIVIAMITSLNTVADETIAMWENIEEEGTEAMGN
jgi:pilus assembly protein Flp/PilA